MNDMKPSIIVHGGAWDIPDDEAKSHVAGCERAASVGFDLLTRGATAIEAVEAAVVVMEDDPTFDAGRGSVLNQAGRVEMDAIIMDGRTLRSGAVAAIQHVQNPVKVARRLMERTQFSLLAGEGALRFALDQGFGRCEEEDLLVGRELEDYKEFLRTGVLRTRQEFAGRDTVGACAVDSEGHTATATSTGGISRKMVGRVGDSPLVGSGAYADDRLGAASATGWGEKIMAVVLSKTCLDRLAAGEVPSHACALAINVLKERVDGFGGLILVTPEGRTGYYHNTPRMAFAYFEGISGKKGSGIKSEHWTSVLE